MKTLGDKKVSLFTTCVVDQFYPEIADSTVHILRKLGVNVVIPDGQTCCGQPAFNSGYWSEARGIAKRFLKIFRGQEYVVTPSGSCATMVRNFYRDLVDDPAGSESVNKLESRVFELSEFLVDILGVDESELLSQTDKSIFAAAMPESKSNSTVKVTYHQACHLSRELGIVEQPRTLIKGCAGVELTEMNDSEVCCGFGGTFSVKYPEISGAMLNDKVDNILESGADAVVACDASCLMQIAGGLKKKGSNLPALHIAQLINDRL